MKNRKNILSTIGISFSLFMTLNSYSQRTEQLLPEEELIPYESKGKFGAANTKGKVVIPAKYESIDRFFFGAAKVSKDEKVGVIDYKGKEIISIEYDEITNFVYTPGFGFSFGIKKGNKMGIVTPTKTILPLTENIDRVIVIEDTLNHDILFATLQKSGATYLVSLINKDGVKIIDNIIADGITPINVKELKTETYFGRGMYDYDEGFLDDYEDYGYGYDEQTYYAVSGYDNTYLSLKKKVSLEESIYSVYNLQGKTVIDFSYKLTNIKKIGNDFLLLTSVNKDADCKNPTKYGIYQLSNSTYFVEPEYDFFEVVEKIEEERDYEDYDDKYSESSQAKQLLSICETLNNMHINTPEDLIDNESVLATLLGFNDGGSLKESYYVFGSEDAIKVLDKDLNVVLDAVTTEGKFRPEQAIVIKSKEEIICAVEVFNDKYRGIGLIDLKTKNYVVNPIYSSVEDRTRYGYGYSNILLESETGNRETYDIFKAFKTTDQNLVEEKNYYKQLNKDYSLFKNEEDKIAIYSVPLGKFITGYKYVYDRYSYDYDDETDILKEFNDKPYFMLQNEKDEYTVLNGNGDVIVPLTENSLRFVDYYGNNTYYVIEYGEMPKSDKYSTKFYGLDGTKFFK